MFYAFLIVAMIAAVHCFQYDYEGPETDGDEVAVTDRLYFLPIPMNKIFSIQFQENSNYGTPDFYEEHREKREAWQHGGNRGGIGPGAPRPKFGSISGRRF